MMKPECSITYITCYLGLILREFFLLALGGGHTHTYTHTDSPNKSNFKKPGMPQPYSIRACLLLEEVYKIIPNHPRTTKSNKAYKYIPELMKVILEERKGSVQNLKHRVALPQEHPANIQPTIAHTIPDKTAELVTNKRTRFA